MLAALMPEDGEALGLLALMEIQASRLGARTGPDGALIPVTEQDRARWDHLLIRRGLDALARAEALGGDGPYVLQAALAACHARARRAADTDGSVPPVRRRDRPRRRRASADRLTAATACCRPFGAF